MFGCQPVLLSPVPDIKAILEYVCTESNKLFNCATYYARQIYFKTRKYVGKSRLDEEMKSNPHFQAMHSQAAQQTCHGVWEAFKSYRELLALWKRGELEDKPKLPKYRDAGLSVASYPKQALKLVDGLIRVPLGSKVKAWFGIASFTLPMPSNLRFEDIRELRILPRNRCFYAEFVYRQPEPAPIQLDLSRALGIDHGIDNWLTCVSTVGESFIVDGRQVKSLNQWYNKEVARLKEGQNQGFWSNQLAHITERRNRQIRDAINKAARIVINYCLKNRIGTIVFGWGQSIKQSVNLGKKNNQKFVFIPTARLKERIAQLAQQYGMQFVETEEANTSAASFLDGDSLPKHGEKPDDWKPSGKRVKRGLYRTLLNWYINADANGGANILQKVSMMLGLDLSKVSRAALTQPQRFRLWQLARKSEAVRLQPTA